MPQLDSFLTDRDDHEKVQSTVLRAAINGDSTIRQELQQLVTGMDEPYRTIAIAMNTMANNEMFIDRLSLQHALADQHLVRLNAHGREERLQPQQAINLLYAGEYSHEQAESYLPLLRDQIAEKRREAQKQEVQQLVNRYATDPAGLKRALDLAAHQTSTAPVEHLHESDLVLEYFANKWTTNQETQGINTGFDHFNDVTNGLPASLNILGAVPSAGKTTLSLQLAHQVIEHNQIPVLFVTYEQSASELRDKALSRLSLINSRSIQRCTVDLTDQAKRSKLENALTKYLDIGRRLVILEGKKTTTVEEIQKVAQSMMTHHGTNRCMVVIDYLQLIPVPNTRAQPDSTPKDRLDHVLLELRQMARDLNSPVLAISSLNRDGYKKKSLDVFKESGAIEYDADSAIVMAPENESEDQAMNNPGCDNPRVIKLHFVKNRNGPLKTLTFKFYPAVSKFVEESVSEFMT